MSEVTAWATRYPGLFTPSKVDYADIEIVFSLDPVDEAAVSRLHLVAVTDDGRVLVCTSLEGWRFLPGGTREPGETLTELAARELIEEAGATLRSELELIGAHVAVSRASEPYRPHLPHPRALWAYAVCRADVTGPPTSPADGEQITDVSALSVRDAVDYLAGEDQLMADVLQLTHELGLV